MRKLAVIMFCCGGLVYYLTTIAGPEWLEGFYMLTLLVILSIIIVKDVIKLLR